MTLDEMESLVENAAFPKDIFGPTDWPAAYKRLQVALHPDKFPDLAQKQRAERLFRRLGEWKTLVEAPETLESGSETYVLGRELGKGDLSNVRMASNKAGFRVVAKVGVNKGVSKLLLKEREVLDVLQQKPDASKFGRYLPSPRDSFLLPDQRRVNILDYLDGLYSAEAIKTAYSGGVGGRHLVWMFKRCLTAVGFAHQYGWVHGAVLPPHLLYLVESHGLRIVDWTLAIPVGKPTIAAPSLYKDWYPPECKAKKPVTASLDIYLAAKSMCFLAGGDPLAETFPDSVPKAMQSYLKGCLLKSPSMRPQDAWKCIEDVTDLAQRLYGAPKFHELKM